MELVNATRKAMDGAPGPADPAVREAAEVITIALSLVAPYVAEEMWEQLGHAPSVASATWPTVDPGLLVTQSVTCVVQVQGKVRGRLEVPPEITEDELRQAKSKIASRVVRGSERPMGRMQAIAAAWTYTGEYRDVDTELTNFDAVTLKDVRAYLDAYPIDKDTVVAFGPLKELSGCPGKPV